MYTLSTDSGFEFPNTGCLSCLLQNAQFLIVYTAKKSIAQLRQLYFKMKDEIFGKARLGGISFNTVGLEKILKDEFTERVCMDDESYPR